MSVRTTITLEDDVFERVKEASRANRVSVKQTVNDLLREGLVARERPPAGRTFGLPARNLGFRPGLNYDKLEDLLEYAEGPNHR